MHYYGYENVSSKYAILSCGYKTEICFGGRAQGHAAFPPRRCAGANELAPVEVEESLAGTPGIVKPHDTIDKQENYPQALLEVESVTVGSHSLWDCEWSSLVN